MNERIQQMIFSLNEKVGIHWTNEDKLKFAELLIRECASRVRYCIQNDLDYIAEDIEQHFGVE